MSKDYRTNEAKSLNPNSPGVEDNMSGIKPNNPSINSSYLNEKILASELRASYGVPRKQKSITESNLSTSPRIVQINLEPQRSVYTKPPQPRKSEVQPESGQHSPIIKNIKKLSPEKRSSTQLNNPANLAKKVIKPVL